MMRLTKMEEKTKLGVIDRCRIGWRAIRLYSQGRTEEAELLLTQLNGPDDKQEGTI